jgi:glucose-6-phosphate dehydrogenase assembly protein OpcA
MFKQSITDKELIDDLINIKNKLNHIPSQREYDKNGAYNCKLFWNRFGSWNNILTQVFNNINQKTKDEVVEKNCKYCGKLVKKKIKSI